MRIPKKFLSLVTVFGCVVVGSSFSTRKPSDFKTPTGYTSNDNLDVPYPLPNDVGRFCDEILCSYDDYEEIMYKLRMQKEALIRRSQIIDNFLSTLESTLEEDLMGTDPAEIPKLAARARTIFQVEQLRLERRPEGLRLTPSGRFIPKPPSVPPTLSQFLAVSEVYGYS